MVQAGSMKMYMQLGINLKLVFVCSVSKTSYEVLVCIFKYEGFCFFYFAIYVQVNRNVGGY